MMKSAHKLGAALAVFVLLSVATYFIITNLQEAASKPETPATTRASENATVSQERVVASSQGPVSEATVGQSTVRHEASSDPGSGNGLPSSETPKIDTTTTTSTPPTTTTTTTTTNVAPIISSAASSDIFGTTEAPPSTTTTSASFEESSSIASSPTSSPESSSTSANLDFTSKIYQEATQSSQPIDLSQDEVAKWHEFKSKYARSYPNQEEEEKRQHIFIGNLRFINTFNRHSNALFKLDVNSFADMSRDEINNQFIGPRQNWTQTSAAAAPPSMRILTDNGHQSPDSVRAVDWGHLMADGGPANQGTCLDSAIFAIVASLEATLNAAGGTKTKLSEQQIIDCIAYNALPQWPPVCSGKLSMVNILDLLQERKIKFATAQEYSHFKMAQQAGQAPPGQCVLPSLSMGADTRPHLGSYVTVPRDNIDEALINSSPLVVAIDASQPTFHFYKTGLYHELGCSTDSYNYHALLMGLSPASENDGPAAGFYAIRASLGPDWGEMGHMRIYKDPLKNRCLPQNFAIYPNIALA